MYYPPSFLEKKLIECVLSAYKRWSFISPALKIIPSSILEKILWSMSFDREGDLKDFEILLGSINRLAWAGKEILLKTSRRNGDKRFFIAWKNKGKLGLKEEDLEDIAISACYREETDALMIIKDELNQKEKEKVTNFLIEIKQVSLFEDFALETLKRSTNQPWLINAFEILANGVLENDVTHECLNRLKPSLTANQICNILNKHENISEHLLEKILNKGKNFSETDKTRICATVLKNGNRFNLIEVALNKLQPQKKNPILVMHSLQIIWFEINNNNKTCFEKLIEWGLNINDDNSESWINIFTQLYIPNLLYVSDVILKKNIKMENTKVIGEILSNIAEKTSRYEKNLSIFESLVFKMDEQSVESSKRNNDSRRRRI